MDLCYCLQFEHWRKLESDFLKNIYYYLNLNSYSTLTNNLIAATRHNQKQTNQSSDKRESSEWACDLPIYIDAMVYYGI